MELAILADGDRVRDCAMAQEEAESLFPEPVRVELFVVSILIESLNSLCTVYSII